ncbi:MAG: hypothetical protein LBD72_02210 [Puniceicoccales bacterium]|jgi:hypothetical protein|nr:hypothetical protein [Puniceicoccales bacterium]
MSVSFLAFKPFCANKRRFLLGATVLLITWVACAFIHIWYRQRIFAVGQQIRILEKEVTELQRQEAILRVKVARLHDPVLLKQYACNLQKPQRNRVYYVALHDMRMDRRCVAQELAIGQKQARRHILSQRMDFEKNAIPDGHF